MASQKRVLVVEDEPLISMMLEDFLDILGHQVVGTADNVNAALKQIEDGGIDAAILDVNLRGGETCWPIADRLNEVGIPFIIASGGGEDRIGAHRDANLLSKPFTMDGVEKALSALS